MIKKIVAFAVIAVLTFTLVSCGSSFSLDTSKLAEDIRNADLFLDTLAPVSESVVKKVVGL